MKIASKVFAGAVGFLIGGCSTQQLVDNAVAVSVTVSDILDLQIIDNLEKYRTAAYAIPSHIALDTGTLSVANQLNPGFKFVHGATSTTTVHPISREWDFGYQRSWNIGWSVVPVTDQNDLARLRWVYRCAIYYGTQVSTPDSFRNDQECPTMPREINAAPAPTTEFLARSQSESQEESIRELKQVQSQVIGIVQQKRQEIMNLRPSERDKEAKLEKQLQDLADRLKQIEAKLSTKNPEYDYVGFHEWITSKHGWLRFQGSDSNCGSDDWVPKRTSSGTFLCAKSEEYFRLVMFVVSAAPSASHKSNSPTPKALLIQ